MKSPFSLGKFPCFVVKSQENPDFVDPPGLLVANDVSRPRALVVAQRSRRRPRETLLVPWQLGEYQWIIG